MGLITEGFSVQQWRLCAVGAVVGKQLKGEE